MAWRGRTRTEPGQGPVGEGVAGRSTEGYTSRTEPYHGYYFKVLKGQGPAAPLGEMDFVVNGAMIGGFALVAAPAEYGVTGVKTFIVSHDGIVYEKDLGPTSARAVQGDGALQPGFDLDGRAGALVGFLPSGPTDLRHRRGPAGLFASRHCQGLIFSRRRRTAMPVGWYRNPRRTAH